MYVLIYKLYNAKDCYIVSTKHPLHKRLSQHQSPHNRCCKKFIIESGDYHIEKLMKWIQTNDLKKNRNILMHYLH